MRTIYIGDVKIILLLLHYWSPDKFSRRKFREGLTTYKLGVAFSKARFAVDPFDNSSAKIYSFSLSFYL